MTEHPHFQNPNRNFARESSNDTSSLTAGKYRTPDAIVHDFISGVIDFDQFSQNLTAISEQIIQEKRDGIGMGDSSLYIDDNDSELADPDDVVKAYRAGKISRVQLGEAIRRDTLRLIKAVLSTHKKPSSPQIIHGVDEQRDADEVVRDYQAGLISKAELGEAIRRDTERLFRTVSHSNETHKIKGANDEFIDDSLEVQADEHERIDKIVEDYVRNVPGSREAFYEMVKTQTEAFQRACGLKPRRK